MERKNDTGAWAQAGLIFVLGGMFALMLGFGARYYVRDHQFNETLSDVVSFNGPGGESLGLSQKEISTLNTHCRHWAKIFPDIQVVWTPLRQTESLEPDTALECSISIKTATDHNIILRNRKTDRARLVTIVITQVDHAKEVYVEFQNTPSKANSRIRTIHLQTTPLRLIISRSTLSGRSKSVRCQAQKKFRADAHLDIREGLNFLQQRSRSYFFSALIIGLRSP